MDEKKEADPVEEPQTSPAEPHPAPTDSPSEEELICHDAAVAGLVNELEEKEPPIVIDAQADASSDQTAATAEQPAAEQPATAESSDVESKQTEADESNEAVAQDAGQEVTTGESIAAADAVGQEQLVASRDGILQQMLGERRLSTAKIRELASELAGLVQASQSDIAAESRAILAAVKGKDDEARQKEQQEINQSAETLQQFTDSIDQLFDALPAIVQSVQDAIDLRSDEQLQAVDEPLRDTLATYRQGMEIIHRMFGRSLDRKPGLIPMEVNLGEVDGDVSQVTDETAFTKAIDELATMYHDVRDKNYHLLRDTKTDCEKQIQKAKVGLKGILSAIDGIDGGLQNERETRAAAGDTSQLDEQASEVVSSWYGAYDGLAAALKELLDRTQLSTLDVELGKPFDPDTMEPQGVVENPELSDDDVAVVLRRGFSFCGELIRPAIVEVVKNS